MDLYDELEEAVKNIPTRFSEMEFVANNINRLDELDSESDSEQANLHRKIIFLLIWCHYQTRDINKTNKLPYGIELFNKKKITNDIMENDNIETYKCVIEKFPPTLQKLLLAYVKFHMVEDS